MDGVIRITLPCRDELSHHHPVYPLEIDLIEIELTAYYAEAIYF
jgi:hypothetical protein